jgi:hypothetical protein
MRELDFPIYPVAAGPRLRWSSILAGAAVTLAVTTALNVLGVGLGLLPAAASPLSPPIDVRAGAWWTLSSGVIAFGLGAWVASRLSDSGRRGDGVLYGLVCWSASTLASVYVPAFALGGVLSIAASGVFVFVTIALEAASAALGGLAGARLFLPVPITEYRRAHPELARGRSAK